MADVVDKFFREDLTEAEEQALSDALWTSDEHALRFGGLAEEAYARYGLPEPSSAGPGAGASSLGTWGVVLLVVVGTALYCLRKPAEVPPPEPVVVVPSAAPLAEGRPKAPAVKPKPRPRPAVPAPTVPPATSYTLLKVVVTQDATGPVVVRVLSPGGEEVRRMYDGTLAAGQWAFRWDGKLADGMMARPGTYTIEINNGRTVQTRKVLVQ
jgi:hypothetical protein